MESPSDIARFAEAQQMNHVPTEAGEVVIEVPEPSVPANIQSNPSNNAWPHTARQTAPLLLLVMVRAPQPRNTFCSAVVCRSRTWICFGLLLLTIATVFVCQFVYNHLFGLLFSSLLVLVATNTESYLTAVKQTRMGGEKVCVGQLLPIYIPCCLGLFFICVFTPTPVLSSWLLLMPSIEPLKAFNVLYTNIVCGCFILLLSIVTRCTVLVLPIRRIRALNIATVSEAAFQMYLLFPSFVCWITYLLTIESQILKCIIITLHSLIGCIGMFNSVRSYYQSLSVWFKRWSTFGSAASHEIAEKAGGICTVCLESYQHPIKLNVCSHVFCEECIMLWLLQKSECPLCRRPVYGVLSL